MNESEKRFCQLYRPIGALLLLLAILLLRSCGVQGPVAPLPAGDATRTALAATPVPTVFATEAPTASAPTALPSAASTTAAPTALLTQAPTAAAPTAGPTEAPTVPPAPPTEAPTAPPTVAPTEVPTALPPTPLPVALPTLNVPAPADYTAEGVKLSGTGEPGATVEVWDGETRAGTAVVGADGTWTLLASLSTGTHRLVVRTVDAAGAVLNESAPVDLIVPEAPSARPGDLTVHGQEYIVQWGDWLMKLARRFYGDSRLYTLIIQGTNDKAAVDPSFTRITNPQHIEAGQKLWIPAAGSGK